MRNYPLRFGQFVIVAREFLLRLDRALHGLDDAREFGDDGVAPGVDDAPLVALDQRRHGGAARRSVASVPASSAPMRRVYPAARRKGASSAAV